MRKRNWRKSKGGIERYGSNWSSILNDSTNWPTPMLPWTRYIVLEQWINEQTGGGGGFQSRVDPQTRDPPREERILSPPLLPCVGQRVDSLKRKANDLWPEIISSGQVSAGQWSLLANTLRGGWFTFPRFTLCLPRAGDNEGVLLFSRMPVKTARWVVNQIVEASCCAIIVRGGYVRRRRGRWFWTDR